MRKHWANVISSFFTTCFFFFNNPSANRAINFSVLHYKLVSLYLETIFIRLLVLVVRDVSDDRVYFRPRFAQSYVIANKAISSSDYSRN